ncbi:hypothetical protein TNCT_294041 [Trichonephila clavata]|uniref:Uncharacterized protein n=1 Tax=Trichonephila clavata TaxID=2740835 RepID=A0A8X6EY59_TRICU|nr:hypothetical protein TNCT_294041 [Trichonephila clavata]
MLNLQKQPIIIKPNNLKKLEKKIRVTSEKETNDKEPVEKKNSEVGYQKKLANLKKPIKKTEIEGVKLEADDDKDNGEKL